MPLQQFVHRRLAALLGEVSVRDALGHAGGEQGVAISRETVDTHPHVLGTGDRGDAAAALGDQILDRLPRARPVVHVDIAVRVQPDRTAAQHGRHAHLLQPPRQGVGAVDRGQQDAVHVLAGQIVLQPVVLASVLRHRQDELQTGLRERRADAADDPGEVRLVEDPLFGLGHHQRDGVRPVGDQGSRRPVGT